MPVAKGLVRAHRIVVTAPALNHDLSLLQRIEDLPIQELVPQASVEAFDITVLPWTAAQDSPRIGLKVRTLSAELRKQHNLGEEVKGALVTAVTAGSPAQEKGIVAGDVIVEAAGKPVATAQSVAKSIAAASESISLKLVNSKGERRDVTVPVPKKPAPIVPGPK